jgi:DNA modification methylase
VYKNVAELIPYARNSRTHDKDQVSQIVASIKEFGFTNPVLIDDEGLIIAGHGRVQAAQKLNLKTVPTICLDYLTEAQKKAYVIADNRLALNAGWDFDMLKVELNDLNDLEFDVSLLGFDDKEINDILADPTEGLVDEDSTPDLVEDPITVEGDIWLLGNHRLMCGDSTSIDAVDKLMDGNKADMVFTDPPYGVNYQSNMRTKSEKFDVIKNDDSFLDIVPIIEIASNGWVFIWTTWKVIDTWIEKTKGLGFMTNMIIWFKGGGGIGDLKKTFSTDYEVALVWNRGKELKGKRIGSVWSINKDSSSSYLHPTQKPVALAEEAIDKTTNNADIVLDLFGGSGSTLIAAEKSARKCYLMELDPKYCDVIIQRWQEFTGQNAVHLDSNKTYNELINDINDG